MSKAELLVGWLVGGGCGSGGDLPHDLTLAVVIQKASTHQQLIRLIEMKSSGSCSRSLARNPSNACRRVSHKSVQC